MNLIDAVWKVIKVIPSWISETYSGIMESFNIPNFMQIIIAIGIIGSLAFGGIKAFKS